MMSQFSSVAQSSPTVCNPWNAAQRASLAITNSWSLPKLMYIELVMPSNHLIFYHPLLLLPSIFPSISLFSMSQLFASGGQNTEVSAPTSVLPMNLGVHWNLGVPGWLISFRMDWLDLLEVQGTLKIFLQHHSSKASILWRSAFFTVQLSHASMTTRKTIALTRWNFVDKVMSLLFNMLSMLVIAFFPRSKRLVISWLQSLSAVILESQK